jgi:hypothetical protein
MEDDYVWTDGKTELVFESFDQAGFHYELMKHGKVWQRHYSDDNLIESVTDVTPEKS